MSSACITAVPQTVAVQGHVEDDNTRGPLAGVQVCIGGTSTCTATSATGDFKLAYPGKPGDFIALSFQAAGYARQSHALTVVPNAWVPTLLRQVAQVTQLRLPAAGDAPVITSVQVGDVVMAVGIPGGALVDTRGQVATGDAVLSLTHWHPLRSVASAPGRLLAENPNGTRPEGLVTYGMSDIEMSQGGALLQVAPGAHLDWTLTVPQAIADDLAARPTKLPNLYSLDPATGLWHFEGNVGTGALAYDPNGARFTARLPHLSAWNVDSNEPAAGGGCVQGHVVNPCGTAAANMPITLWFTGAEELKDWHATTDGSGNFCIATPLTAFFPSPQTTHYFISGAQYTDTAMCNPVSPATCFNCSPADEALGYSWCSWCQYYDPTFLGQGGSSQTGETPTIYHDGCGAAELSLTGGQFCGGSCTTVPDAVIADPNCSKPVTPGNAPPPDPCSQATAKQKGDPCNPATDTCCPAADSLECRDYLCVPKDGP
jgi:hypothetical protein